MAHVKNVSASQMCAAEQQDCRGPMPAVSNPKADFVQAVVLAFQNFRQEKRVGM